ncbi:HD domain-containing protein [Arthrobacter glacialis]|uniref:HD domain-containing protein n=1 Tax=Arthrobacter glacialis TaxID=1664 RepID=UPI000CD3FFC8|nr:ATP-binding protein [Arthrobacter glacialis]POH60303.1 hypothetical protein CVS28_05075 [Arthrobacter glacialis]
MENLKLGGSKLEKLASEALNRQSLGAYNMYSARQTLTEMLGAVGRTAEFSTYTKHDISHIDALLAAADWIIPTETLEQLTVADALLITLSIYVHDLGMLVTKSEYENRSQTGFLDFKAQILKDDTDKGIDFRDRLDALKEDDREHFLYEEFVREHHAERIEAWISNKPYLTYGDSSDAVAIIEKLFSPLDKVLRTDIAMIARSHHLDDLDDLSKYKIERKYGTDEQDCANLQYAAIILRTADLLHMTRDRTPVIQYRLASPSDPMGQKEWRKQQAVRVVAPRTMKEGHSNVIEIHARFENAEGFFALMEYLDYCELQLKLSHAWAMQGSEAASNGRKYVFGWNAIDREQVEADGFDRRQFTFQFDQQRVLDLLTGHTLYNDASVAIRELVQNSIDAVRLRKNENSLAILPGDEDIRITFDSKLRTLRILDNGVGMTQETIEEHFLRVGSSSYQTKEFKETHPSFTSISRFGIGVLSAFMIADEVRVATIPVGESIGRELVLKSVHGRYLIKDFDQNSDYARRIGKQGTEIELKLRKSSDINGDIRDILKKWIIIPNCRVTCYMDGDDGHAIGSDSIELALERILEQLPSTHSRRTRVSKIEKDGVEIAIAQSWNALYQEWEILRRGRSHLEFDTPRRLPGQQSLAVSGVSVQGIRVTESVPGFRDDCAVMLINVNGPNSPATNVARTDLEGGLLLDGLIKNIYSSVMTVIQDEMRVIEKRVSKRLALKEAAHLYRAAMSGERGRLYTKPNFLREVLRSAPLHPVEANGALEAMSSIELESSGVAVLIGPAADDAARFLDWLPKPKGLLSLLQDGGLLTDVGDDSVPLLGGQDALFAYDELLWETLEPSSIRSLESGTSLFLTLEKTAGRWSSDRKYVAEFATEYRRLQEMASHIREFRNRSSLNNVFSTSGDVLLPGLEDTDVVFVNGNRLFLPGSGLCAIFNRLEKRVIDGEIDSVFGEMATLSFIADWMSPWGKTLVPGIGKLQELLENWLADEKRKCWIERDALIEIASLTPTMKIWSSGSAWQRRGDVDES